MSIRIQLLGIALATLLLPWAGCQYARELETTLRVSQENSLQAAADTIAHAVSAQPERVFGAADGHDDAPFDAQAGDLYVFPLHNQPLLDGYREDWGVAAEPAALANRGMAARVQAGSWGRYLYLYLEADAPRFSPEPADVHPNLDHFDRVDLTVRRPDGGLEAVFLATGAPGPIEAQRIVQGDDGVSRAAPAPRIQAFWLQTSRGFHLEVRLPKSLVASRLWVTVAAGTGAGGAGTRAASGAGEGADAGPGGRLFAPTPGLDELLATFIGPATRATVIDTNALKLGSAGALAMSGDEEQRSAASSWYRRLVVADTAGWPVQQASADRLRGGAVTAALAGRRSVEWLRAGARQASLLSAAAPLSIDGRTRGAVVLEQPGDQLLDLRDRALEHLFNLTLLATALAAAVAVGVASWISLRIERLRAAAETAVTPDGGIRLGMPESQRADEIGALARSFERLLARLDEHARYLRTLGGKLSHELRTPLTIVRSSLDNLESEGVRGDQRLYLTRAREGVLRLQSILSALGAAARVETSIGQAERQSFDLGELLRSTVAGYRDGFPAARIELDAPTDACFMQGAPDLIVQMLDKLIENAVDFCPPPGTIIVRLARRAGGYEVAVDNDGPPIPANVLDRLFESLFEHRQGRDDRPHFGLGLYIVRLIAEFHGGTAAAANRPETAGAVFTVNLPLI